MGIDVNIYVHEKDLVNLLKKTFDFTFLLEHSMMRYASFLNVFGLDQDKYPEGIDSEKLFAEIAKLNSPVKNRETWVRLFESYDLLFVPETVTPKDDNYIEIYSFYATLISYAEEHLKELLDKYTEFMGAVGELNEAEVIRNARTTGK